ncbi:MAG: [FeFe] hydrogenase H-cluster radical SAM maturase HydG [Candidatus Omnitrophota bacterium]
MKHINEDKIVGLIEKAKNVSARDIKAILEKSKLLKRLTLEETASLLAVKDEALIKKIFDAAWYVKDTIYGRRMVIFAPLYISNICSNNCLYCAFKSDNKLVERKALSLDEIKNEVELLLKKGHKRILLVAGEKDDNVSYYVDAIRAIYSVKIGKNYIRRVNINCAPLSVEDFKKIKAAGIGTYQLFQETYHDVTYRKVHPKGPKSDPDNRLDAVDRAFKAGIDDLGIGVLYGLYDYKFDTLALLSHIEYLEKTFGLGPHTISVPRIEPAFGSDFSKNVPYKISDSEFKKIIAILRLSVPYTGMILSTRESSGLRDELFSLGISQISAESKTSPGGYQEGRKDIASQFAISDERTLDEVVASLIKKDFIPSFCAACYRKERTGGTFMNLAKPGAIKDKCTINGIITFKEYLDDFASDEVKKNGNNLINRFKERLGRNDKALLEEYLKNIEQGARDEYI